MASDDDRKFFDIVSGQFQELYPAQMQRVNDRADSLFELIGRANTPSQIDGYVRMELRPLSEQEGRDVMSLVVAMYGMWIIQKCEPAMVDAQTYKLKRTILAARVLLDSKQRDRT